LGSVDFLLKDESKASDAQEECREILHDEQLGNQKDGINSPRTRKNSMKYPSNPFRYIQTPAEAKTPHHLSFGRRRVMEDPPRSKTQRIVRTKRE
jgi:hypothetical protein